MLLQKKNQSINFSIDEMATPSSSFVNAELIFQPVCQLTLSLKQKKSRIVFSRCYFSDTLLLFGKAVMQDIFLHRKGPFMFQFINFDLPSSVMIAYLERLALFLCFP